MPREKEDYQRPLDEAIDSLRYIWNSRFKSLHEEMNRDLDCLIDLLDVEFQETQKAPTSHTDYGDFQEVGPVLEALGDNLVSVWHFNSDTKVWAYYDPNLAEGNTLTHMITGETYLIQIKSKVEVILNRDARSLTLVGDNCWNQIVW